MRETAFGSFGGGWFASCALGYGEGRLIARVGDPRQPGTVQIWGWQGTDASTATPLHSFDVPEGSPSFPWVEFWSGTFYAAYHDGTQAHLLNLKTGQESFISPCDNNSPFCFGNGYFAWQGAGADGWPVSRMELATANVVSRVRQGQGTGLSRVDEQGRVVTIDEDRFSLPGATIPSFDQDLAVGEGQQGGVLWRIGAATGLVWPGTESFTPHCDVDAGTVAICTAGGKDGIRLFCGTRAELLTLVAPVDTGGPTPVEPGGGTPTPPTQETPKMDGITDAQFETLKAERAKYRAFDQKAFDAGDKSSALTEREMGDILNRTCWAHRTEGLGMQVKGSGAILADEQVVWHGLRGRNAEGKFFGQDVLAGASIGKAEPYRAEAVEIVAGDPAFVAPIQPAGESGGGTGGNPPSGGGTEPIPPVDTSLVERIAAAEAAITALQGRPMGLSVLQIQAIFAQQFASIESRLAALEAGTGGSVPSTGGPATEASLLKLIAIVEKFAGLLPLGV